MLKTNDHPILAVACYCSQIQLTVEKQFKHLNFSDRLNLLGDDPHAYRWRTLPRGLAAAQNANMPQKTEG